MAETVVSQATSPRRPTRTSGTTNVESPGSSAKPRLPKQTSPEPGSSTSLLTSARAVVSDHHLSASAKRVGPDVRTSAATPQPTSPSPRRSQATRVDGGQQLDQGRGGRRVEPDGPDDERRGCRVVHCAHGHVTTVPSDP